MKIETLHLVVCMKPLEGTYVHNIASHAVAGLNINGCRIPIDIENEPPVGDAFYLKKGSKYPNQGKSSSKIMGTSTDRVGITMSKGRYPANVILQDEVGAILNAQSGTRKTTWISPQHQNNREGDFLGALKHPENQGYNDTGGAARFFKTFGDEQ